MIMKLRCHESDFQVIENFLFQQYIPQGYENVKIQLEVIETGKIYRYVVNQVFGNNLIATD